MCYIKYHPLDSATDVELAGVIIEGRSCGNRDSVESVVGSVLLKGVREIFSEFFEKSIDKEKIDAILNGTVRFWSGPGRGM